VPHQLSLDALLDLGLRPGFGNEMPQFGGVKIFVDGTGHDGYGNHRLDLKWDAEELITFVSRGDEGGLQLWMRVTSPTAIPMAAAAVEAALRRRPGPHRHRLDHGGDVVDSVEDMRRLRDLGIRLVTTPEFRYSPGPYPTAWPRSATSRALCAGRPVGGTTFLAEERIAVEEGLRMFSIWAAPGAFEEADKGSIAPGKLGDLAVLSHDPLTVPADELAEVRVDATMPGGRVVYER
jgi:predicted amidohydrolase YtcJ